ncbi:MAG: hypothetical protein ABW223_12210 [Rariglobus sp.]
MNTPNALGFISAGMIMAALHFLPTVTGVRELWLLVMGGVLMAVGTATLAQVAWLQVAPKLAVVTQSMSAKRAEARAGSTGSAVRRVSI